MILTKNLFRIVMLCCFIGVTYSCDSDETEAEVFKGYNGDTQLYFERNQTTESTPRSYVVPVVDLTVNFDIVSTTEGQGAYTIEVDPMSEAVLGSDFTMTYDGQIDGGTFTDEVSLTFEYDNALQSGKSLILNIVPSSGTALAGASTIYLRIVQGCDPATAAGTYLMISNEFYDQWASDSAPLVTTFDLTYDAVTSKFTAVSIFESGTNMILDFDALTNEISVSSQATWTHPSYGPEVTTGTGSLDPCDPVLFLSLNFEDNFGAWPGAPHNMIAIKQ